MKLCLILLTLFIVECNSREMVKPDQTINNTFSFDLQKYLGTWFEIARLDNSFERGLQGVTANYTLRKDGKIKVLNQGYKNNLNGKLKTAIGKAILVSQETPRNLKVSFFLNFYAPYNILELDENYQYALIGSNSSKYLWILSRTPKLDSIIYKNLLEKAKARGYDTDKVMKVMQPN